MMEEFAAHAVTANNCLEVHTSTHHFCWVVLMHRQIVVYDLCITLKYPANVIQSKFLSKITAVHTFTSSEGQGPQGWLLWLLIGCG